MRINNNLMAMNAYRQLGITNGSAAKSMEKLSSGYRINRAGDDAAGLAISEKMRAQIRGLNMASKNAQDGISLIQTAEGALTETHAILQRMRELAVQSASDTNVEVDRNEIQKEIDQLAQEISRIAETTEFNTQKLLDGSFANAKFHIGANSDQNISLAVGDMGSTALGVGTEYKASGTSGGDTLYSGTDAIAKFVDVGGTIGSGQAAVAGYYKVDGSGNATTELFRAVDTKYEAGQTVLFGINVNSQSGADAAITTINNALEKVSAERSKLGAYQNRLEHTIKNLDTSAENLQASESRIRDVDYAEAA